MSNTLQDRAATITHVRQVLGRIDERDEEVVEVLLDLLDETTRTIPRAQAEALAATYTGAPFPSKRTIARTMAVLAALDIEVEGP